MVDELIREMALERRHRTVLIVAAVVGILASAATGVAFALGGFEHLARGASGYRNPGGLVFFVAPFAVAMAIGYAIYGVLRWRARRG
jgi:hypothetical protein